MQPTLYAIRNRNSSGFTLIEIAIVLVIIGLLLGGVLKGQELINSARVKNLAGDFKNVPVFIYGYQDRFRAVPGDDMNAAARVSGVTATTPANAQGNGAINGAWDSMTPTDETILFWQHIRLAGLTAGSTATPTAGTIAAFVPQNSAGGRLGISSTSPITGLTGSYFDCSSGIDGRLVTQLDATLDDGVSDTGLVQARANNGTPPTAAAVAAVGVPVPGTAYTVCVGI